ncbi:NAD(+)/NADH kinase [Candidatus Undinarchaeota archaeon]
MIKNIMKFTITAHKTEPNVIEIAKNVKSLLNGHDVYYSGNLAKALKAKPYSGKVDMVIAIGGDGTMLKTAYMQKDSTPILGIKKGGIGFLCECTEKDYKSAIKRVLKGGYRTVERAKLDYWINGKKYKPVLNELVIMTQKPGKLSKLKVRVDDKGYKTFRADGLIIATPTGSTAYSLSAGGPIVHPHSEIILVTPLSPHSLASKTLVIPDSSKIEIVVEQGDMVLVADGLDRYDLKHEKITLKKSEKSSNIVRFKESFYEKLEFLHQ